MKTIVFINEKGGIGKTSCCFNIAWEMAKKNRILLLDLDGQRANLTYFCGMSKPDDLPTMYDVLQKNRKPAEAIKNIKENLDIIPATVDVSGIGQTAKVSRMKQVIKEVSAGYDYCFIDVSPSPNWGQYLALSSSDFAIIPMLPDIASLEADNGVIESIQEVQDSSNSSLKVLGILFNRNDNRTNMSKQVKAISEKFAEKLESKIFDSCIRNSVSMGENVYHHIGITDYDANSSVAEDVRQLVNEIESEVLKNG